MIIRTKSNYTEVILKDFTWGRLFKELSPFLENRGIFVFRIVGDVLDENLSGKKRLRLMDFARYLTGSDLITVGVCEIGTVKDSVFEFCFLLDLVYSRAGVRFGFTREYCDFIFGATRRFVSDVGLSMAKQVLFGDFLDAERLYNAGFINGIWEDVEASLKELVDRLNANSQYALLFCKRVLEATAYMPLSEGLKVEREVFSLLFKLPHRKEAINAFLDKRKPQFKEVEDEF